jgi:hypothetical protein
MENDSKVCRTGEAKMATWQMYQREFPSRISFVEELKAAADGV